MSIVAQQTLDVPMLIGSSPQMSQLMADIELGARSDSKILITGETGAGKEVVARLVHQKSRRHLQPFISLNCAAIPDTLIESEMFGHTRGSFTGAYHDKPGVAMLADRGTLFLDEIGEMSPRMQAVLLRFTETREIHRIGSDRRVPRVDTRIISATNRDLSARIASGDFRQDLFYRLNVVQIEVPPLRDRASDIVLLFNHFLTHYARVHQVVTPRLLAPAYDLLLSYSWPGNVRELKNLAERLVVRQSGNPIGPADLPREIRRADDHKAAASAEIATQSAGPHRPVAEAAWREMLDRGKSFWIVVHPPFIDRELTKSDLRYLVGRGLECTQGSYRKLIELFNMSARDYKRFLAFLYQHDCHVAFHPFRETQVSAGRPARLQARAG